MASSKRPRLYAVVPRSQCSLAFFLASSGACAWAGAAAVASIAPASTAPPQCRSVMAGGAYRGSEALGQHVVGARLGRRLVGLRRLVARRLRRLGRLVAGSIAAAVAGDRRLGRLLGLHQGDLELRVHAQL